VVTELTVSVKAAALGNGAEAGRINADLVDEETQRAVEDYKGLSSRAS
jgi:hypothetical protein